MNDNLIELIVILVVGGIAFLGKILGQMREVQRQQALRQRVLEQQEKLPPVKPAPPADDMGDEIEAFMRRAAEQHAAKQAAAKQRAAARQQRAEGVAARPIRRTPQPRLVEKDKPIEAVVVGDQPVGGQVAKQVETYLDTGSLTQHAAQLGGEVAQADRQIDQRLHQVFDHQISRLEAAPGEAAKPPVAVGPAELTGEPAAEEIPATFATGLTDLLADPESIRQAIVFSEILRRPEERWA